jgi:hypothetical protein
LLLHLLLLLHELVLGHGHTLAGSTHHVCLLWNVLLLLWGEGIHLRRLLRVHLLHGLLLLLLLLGLVESVLWLIWDGVALGLLPQLRDLLLLLLLGFELSKRV